jgi:4-hydroxy-tetrahydrodipicolinate synthase
MSTLALQGAYTALVTPFTAEGDVDLGAFEALVERQIAGGISGLVPCGTTGETPTLTDDEQVELVRRAVKVSAGRVPVIAGTGSFSTKKSIEASKRALEAGASAVMVVMPYYSKPTQEGLVQHVTAVAAAVGGAPVVLYNIPGRTGVDLGPEATERICEKAANVVATKEATGNVLRCQDLKRRLGDRLAVLSGDDGLTLPMMAVGAAGVISVSSNVYPGPVSEVVRLALAGDFAAARRRHLALLPVHDAMFLEANPGPVKAACAWKGWMRADVRLPLVAASEGTRSKLEAILGAYEAAR